MRKSGAARGGRGGMRKSGTARGGRYEEKARAAGRNDMVRCLDYATSCAATRRRHDMVRFLDDGARGNSRGRLLEMTW